VQLGAGYSAVGHRVQCSWAQGTLQWTQGTVQRAQGTVQWAQDTVQLAQGTVQLAQGTVQLAHGTVQLAQDTVQLGTGYSFQNACALCISSVPSNEIQLAVLGCVTAILQIFPNHVHWDTLAMPEI
jgi:putative membrane protein